MMRRRYFDFHIRIDVWVSSAVELRAGGECSGVMVSAIGRGCGAGI